MLNSFITKLDGCCPAWMELQYYIDISADKFRVWGGDPEFAPRTIEYS